MRRSFWLSEQTKAFLSSRWGRKGAFLLLLIMIGSACTRDKAEGDEEEEDSFDREGMLMNYGENLIIPGYEALETAVLDLEDAAKDFTGNPSNATLQTTQDRLNTAYLKWQALSIYEFGPAKDVALRSFVNTFPTDTAAIQDNISTGNYDLSSFDSEDIKGFPALDYLLFDPVHGNAAVVDSFSNSPNAAEREDYLLDVIDDLEGNVKQVLDDWEPGGGDHLSEWVDATGTDVGSSLGLLVNQLNFDLEIVKNAEIGIPLGKKSLGNPKPGKCQAYFGESSMELSIAHLKALRDCYLGKGTDGDELGIDENLEHIDATTSTGPLAKAIRDQFSVCIQKAEQVSTPLSDAVVNDPNPADELHTELKKLVALLKSDMPSELGVQITYQDNDGD